MNTKTLLVLAACCCALPVLLMVGPLLLTGMLLSGGSMNNTNDAEAGLSRCTLNHAGPDADAGDLDQRQLDYAQTIVAVGQRLDIPPRGWVIALAAALQESGLHNLDFGDRDSLGLFQQRPSAGWGTPAQLTTPAYAARAFYGGPHSPTTNGGLMAVDGWRQMPVWQAAQTVQRSAFPMAYAAHEKTASKLVDRLTDRTAGCQPLASGTWTLPIDGDYTLTSRYGARTSPTRGGADFHTGLDFAAPSGTPVHAISNGTVVSAGPSGSGYGNLIRIRHTGGVESWYTHLATVAVKPGTRVSAGQVIGAVGTTGNSTGPHLHLEIRLDDQPTNPETWLTKKGLHP